jgi:hypothetical protein
MSQGTCLARFASCCQDWDLGVLLLPTSFYKPIYALFSIHVKHYLQTLIHNIFCESTTYVGQWGSSEGLIKFCTFFLFVVVGMLHVLFVHVVIGHKYFIPWWQVCWKWPEGKFWHLAYHIRLKIHPQISSLVYQVFTCSCFWTIWPCTKYNTCEVESNFFWRLVCKQGCSFTQGEEVGSSGKEWRRFEGASTKLMYSVPPTKLKLTTELSSKMEWLPNFKILIKLLRSP